MDRNVEELLAAPVPADIDQPDRVLYGLTARQVAILATVAVVLWLAYQALTPAVSPLLVLAGAMPVLAGAGVVALGRRDGISLDRWLLAAVRAARAPRVMVPAGDGPATVPAWAPAPQAAGVSLAPLRLPAAAVDDGGVVDLRTGGRVALCATSTVNFDLRSPAEQAALLDGYARWLNALSGPVQIVVSTRRVDMDAYAAEVDARVDDLPHPALVGAAVGYAQFLRWLGDERDPLARRVTVVHRVGAHTDPLVARRQADQSARALAGLGVSTRVLDGGLVTDVLADACHPWGDAASGHARPEAVIAAELLDGWQTDAEGGSR